MLWFIFLVSGPMFQGKRLLRSYTLTLKGGFPTSIYKLKKKLNSRGKD